MQGLAAVVLAGGRSLRMGRDKAAIELEGRAFVVRVAGALREVAEPVVVVAAIDQQLPELPDGVRIVRDAAPYEGPLVALGTGLGALPDGLDLAFVAATDLPQLRPCVVRRMAELARGHDAAIFERAGQPQLLCAVYSVRAREPILALIGAGERSMRALARRLAVRVVTAGDLLADEEVRRLDPELASFLDVDTPEDLPAA